MANITVTTLNSVHKQVTAQVKSGRTTKSQKVGQFSRVVSTNPLESGYVFDPFYNRAYDADTLKTIASELELLNRKYKKVTINRARKQIKEMAAELGMTF